KRLRHWLKSSVSTSNNSSMKVHVRASRLPVTSLIVRVMPIPTSTPFPPVNGSASLHCQPTQHWKTARVNCLGLRVARGSKPLMHFWNANDPHRTHEP